MKSFIKKDVTITDVLDCEGFMDQYLSGFQDLHEYIDQEEVLDELIDVAVEGIKNVDIKSDAPINDTNELSESFR